MNSFVSGVTTGDFHSVLVGDAAHPSRPSVGQGANMALEDAVQFALLLRETESVREEVSRSSRGVMVGVEQYSIPSWVSPTVMESIVCRGTPGTWTSSTS